MDYKAFEEKIISKIQRNKSCSKALKKNIKLINEYYNNDSYLNIQQNFVNRLVDTILSAKKYDEADKFLKNPAMGKILSIFRQSNVLLRACETHNKKAAKWLATMNIDPYVHDKKGMTALMHAARYYDLASVAESLVVLDKNQLMTEDEDGNTSLFHAVKVKDCFDRIVKNKIDIDHRNRNGDNIFSYICRCHKPKLIASLLKWHNDVDLSAVNKEGRTGAMYLAESDNFTELRGLYATGRDLNLLYKNENNETIVSSTINRYYDTLKDGVNASPEWAQEEFGIVGTFAGEYDIKEISQSYTKARNIARTINALIDIGCDFNCAIDKDGNTPMMFFLMIKDYVSALNLLKYCKTLDLNYTNNLGVNATSLCALLTPNDFEPLRKVKEHIFMEISYQKFQDALAANPTYIKDAIVNCGTTSQLQVTPYSPPKKILSLQSALSEGYFARNGEDGKKDAFDILYGPFMELSSNHPFI